MPLRVPFVTLGGPAHPDRKKDFMRRWWDVHSVKPSLFSSRVYLDDGVLQGQAHRSTTVVAHALAFTTYQRPAEDIARDVRRTNGDLNTDPYRVVLQEPPYYYALATSDTAEELQADWDTLTAMLAKVDATQPPAVRSRILAELVTARLLADAAAGDKGTTELLERFVAEVARTATFERLTALAESVLKEQVTDKARLFQRELLIARATVLRSQAHQLESSIGNHGSTSTTPPVPDALGVTAAAPAPIDEAAVTAWIERQDDVQALERLSAVILMRLAGRGGGGGEAPAQGPSVVSAATPAKPAEVSAPDPQRPAVRPSAIDLDPTKRQPLKPTLPREPTKRNPGTTPTEVAFFKMIERIRTVVDDEAEAVTEDWT